MPSTRPSGLVTPSMASTEPLGFTAKSMEGCPTASTYWVATCPFAIMESSSAGGATKRPSPWLMATVCVSPTSMRLIQGDIVLATRVRTSVLW